MKVDTRGSGGLDDGSANTVISSITTRDARVAVTTGTLIVGPADSNCVDELPNIDWAAVGGLYASTKALTNISIEPTTLTTRGPSSHNTNISIKFTTSTAIPNNGSIVATLKNEWEFTAQTVCSAAAITANAAGSGPTGINSSSPVSGRVITITNMGALGANTAVDLSCTYVVATNSGSTTTKLVDTLLTYDATGGN